MRLAMFKIPQQAPVADPFTSHPSLTLPFRIASSLYVTALPPHPARLCEFSAGALPMLAASPALPSPTQTIPSSLCGGNLCDWLRFAFNFCFCCFCKCCMHHDKHPVGNACCTLRRGQAEVG